MSSEMSLTFSIERIWDFLETTHLTRQKRGLEAFRAFSCVFYISTSNVVQFGSITLTLKELLPPWQIRRPHPCIDVLLCCQKSESAKGGPFDISYFVKNSNVLNSYILSSSITYWFKKKTIEFAALSNDFILQSNFRASKKPILVISNN